MVRIHGIDFAKWEGQWWCYPGILFQLACQMLGIPPRGKADRWFSVAVNVANDVVSRRRLIGVSHEHRISGGAATT